MMTFAISWQAVVLTDEVDDGELWEKVISIKCYWRNLPLAEVGELPTSILGPQYLATLPNSVALI